MAVAELEAGSYTDTPSTTWDTINTTTPQTTDGAFQFFADVANLAAGEVFEIRVIEKVQNSSGTQREAWRVCLNGVQDKPCVYSPTLLLLHGWDFQMRQINGTGRAIPWSIRYAT